MKSIRDCNFIRMSTLQQKCGLSWQIQLCSSFLRFSRRLFSRLFPSSGRRDGRGEANVPARLVERRGAARGEEHHRLGRAVHIQVHVRVHVVAGSSSKFAARPRRALGDDDWREARRRISVRRMRATESRAHLHEEAQSR